jgi:uncharacterized protein YdiU (UPF0061 family)
VLVRLSHSHIRFGTFQRLAFEGNAEAIARLVEYCVAHFDPDPAPRRSATDDARAAPSLEKGETESAAGPRPGAENAPIGDAAARFFERVARRTARLVGQWMAAGFAHGVVNSDNMNVTGESFDYGPWRFLPVCDPDFTAAYFDETGLYAYGRQAEAAAWNLSRLGGALTPVADTAALNAAFSVFPAEFEAGMAEAFFRRLGLKREGPEDFALAIALLQWMEKTRVPFERPFFDWFCGRASEARARRSPFAGAYAADDFKPVRERLLAAEPDRPERLAHPYFARAEPCTMLIDEVEALWAKIADADDWSGLAAKLAEIAEMREALGFDASVYASDDGRGDKGGDR